MEKSSWDDKWGLQYFQKLYTSDAWYLLVSSARYTSTALYKCLCEHVKTSSKEPYAYTQALRVQSLHLSRQMFTPNNLGSLLGGAFSRDLSGLYNCRCMLVLSCHVALHLTILCREGTRIFSLRKCTIDLHRLSGECSATYSPFWSFMRLPFWKTNESDVEKQ